MSRLILTRGTCLLAFAIVILFLPYLFFKPTLNKDTNSKFKFKKFRIVFQQRCFALVVIDCLCEIFPISMVEKFTAKALQNEELGLFPRISISYCPRKERQRLRRHLQLHAQILDWNLGFLRIVFLFVFVVFGFPANLVFCKT